MRPGTFEVHNTAWEPHGHLTIRDANNRDRVVRFATREMRDRWLVGTYGEQKARRLLRRRGRK